MTVGYLLQEGETGSCHFVITERVFELVTLCAGTEERVKGLPGKWAALWVSRPKFNIAIQNPMS